MSDTLKGIVGVIVLFIVAIVGASALLAGLCTAWSHIYAGTYFEYEGTVQAVSRSNFLAPHTNIVLRTYSEDEVSFTLNGYYSFDIGTQYIITMTMKPYVYGLVCWGEYIPPAEPA